MTRYIAWFMKDVLGENGHEAEICQRSIEIEAPSRGHAAELAKIKFCDRESEGLAAPCRSRSHCRCGIPALARSSEPVAVFSIPLLPSRGRQIMHRSTR